MIRANFQNNFPESLKQKKGFVIKMKKSTIKKLAMVILGIILLLPLTSCLKQAEKDKPVHVIMVNALNGHPVYEQQAKAAKKAAEDYGVNLEITGPVKGCTNVLDEYIKSFESAIAAKPDAIICEPFEPAVYEYAKKAFDAGIPVFCTSAGTDNPDYYISCCGTDNTQYGIDAADCVAEKTDGKANILVVMTSNNNVEQTKQFNALKDRIAEKYPNMHIVTNVEDNADEKQATEVIGKSFKDYPEIDTVIMLEATGGPIAADVSKELGKDILILDIDSGEKTISNIINGTEWASMVQNFYKRGYETVKMANEYVKSGGKTKFEKFVNSSVTLITKENASKCDELLWSQINANDKK